MGWIGMMGHLRHCGPKGSRGRTVEFENGRMVTGLTHKPMSKIARQRFLRRHRNRSHPDYEPTGKPRRLE